LKAALNSRRSCRCRLNRLSDHAGVESATERSETASGGLESCVWFGIEGTDVDWKEHQRLWQYQCGQLLVFAGTNGADDSLKFVMPYWVIVISMTLLSAWLLLRQPKKTKAAAPTSRGDGPMRDHSQS